MGVDFADSGEAEHLKTAAVREDRASPVHELVQAPRLGDDLYPGTDVKMVGVAKDDLRPHFAQLTVIDRFDTCLRANRHEDGRVNNTVRCFQPPEPSLAGR